MPEFGSCGSLKAQERFKKCQRKLLDEIKKSQVNFDQNLCRICLSWTGRCVFSIQSMLRREPFNQDPTASVADNEEAIRPEWFGSLSSCCCFLLSSIRLKNLATLVGVNICFYQPSSASFLLFLEEKLSHCSGLDSTKILGLLTAHSTIPPWARKLLLC